MCLYLSVGEGGGVGQLKRSSGSKREGGWREVEGERGGGCERERQTDRDRERQRERQRHRLSD